VQGKQNGKHQVVIPVGVYFIIENQKKEYYQYPEKTLHECPHQIIGSGVAEYVFIETGKIIDQKPEYRQNKHSQVKAITECEGDIVSEFLGLDDFLPESVEQSPGNCCT
jgi:hypothetical protein